MAKEIIFSNQTPPPIGPYSQGVKMGNMIFLSGQINVECSLLNDVAQETTQVMSQIMALLAEGGATMKDIVKTTIFLKNMDDFPIVNQAYGAFFEGDYPARETVQVAKLPKDVNVEISVTAILS